MLEGVLAYLLHETGVTDRAIVLIHMTLPTMTVEQ